MSDYDEDFVDFPSENTDKLAECLVGAYRAESTYQRTAKSEITPHFDGSTSWFNYEELIDDWLDLAVLEAAIRGSALKKPTCRRCINVQRKDFLTENL